MRKPDRAIYELALERMALPPEDRLRRRPAGQPRARARLGMATVHHTAGATTSRSSRTCWRCACAAAERGRQALRRSGSISTSPPEARSRRIPSADTAGLKW